MHSQTVSAAPLWSGVEWKCWWRTQAQNGQHIPENLRYPKEYSNYRKSLLRSTQPKCKENVLSLPIRTAYTYLSYLSKKWIHSAASELLLQKTAQPDTSFQHTEYSELQRCHRCQRFPYPKLFEKLEPQTKQKHHAELSTTPKHTHFLKLVPKKTSSGTSIVTASHHTATSSRRYQDTITRFCPTDRSNSTHPTSKINSEP